MARTAENPTGFNGARLSDYPRLTVRVPPESVERLRDLAEQSDLPQWRVPHDAIQAYRRRDKALRIARARWGDVARALAIAPLAGLAVLALFWLWESYSRQEAGVFGYLYVLTYMAAFCYLTAGTAFVPILLLTGQLRRPQVIVAIFSGASAAVAGSVVLATSFGHDKFTTAAPIVRRSLTMFALAGAVAGFAYWWTLHRRVNGESGGPLSGAHNAN